MEAIKAAVLGSGRTIDRIEGEDETGFKLRVRDEVGRGVPITFLDAAGERASTPIQRPAFVKGRKWSAARREYILSMPRPTKARPADLNPYDRTGIDD